MPLFIPNNKQQFMLFNAFWEKLEAPIVGLAPMDGVTDAAFRHVIAKYSKPSFIVTEFTNVEGLARGATALLQAFLYEEAERPIVAQVFGVELESYYKVAVMLASMGFDGIDINMGCPAKKVFKHGAGAALIQNPDLAKELIRTTKRGVKDWADGISLEEAGVHPNIISAIKGIGKGDRGLIPVSVKTRIGYNSVVVEEWVSALAEAEPAAITVHGRTLKQMYTGEADWDSIAKAVAVLKGSGIKCLGNGDIQSMKGACEKIEKYGVDGVMVGRAVFGNPWFFGDKEPSVQEKLQAAIEHSRYLEEKLPDLQFVNIRKHLCWYCKDFDGARELRAQLMHVENAGDVEEIIRNSQV